MVLLLSLKVRMQDLVVINISVPLLLMIKLIIVYGNGGNSNVGTAIHGTISGTCSISVVANQFLIDGNTYEGAVVCIDTVNNKIIIAYRDDCNSNKYKLLHNKWCKYKLWKYGYILGAAVSVLLV